MSALLFEGNAEIRFYSVGYDNTVSVVMKNMITSTVFGNILLTEKDIDELQNWLDEQKKQIKENQKNASNG